MKWLGCLWENKIDKIYWRGSSTGNDDLQYNLKNFAKIPRLALVMLAKLYPDIIDAKFTYYTDEAFKEDKNGASHDDINSDSFTATKKNMKSKSFKKKQSRKNRTMKKI